MRIWSLHPKYLDTKGLVALWRETLLAKHVLEGKTTGYKNHPQLKRFKNSEHPLDSINQYLAVVFEESKCRGYHFDRAKINWDYVLTSISATRGQVDYERDHLLQKLKSRDPEKYLVLLGEKVLETQPLFSIIEGPVEDWEIMRI